MELHAFEFAVITAAQRLGPDACAPAILAEIDATTGRTTARGALYTTLARLESKRLLRSRMGDATPVRGGKRKRFYQLTPAGVRAAEASKAALIDSWRTLGRALGEL